MSPSFFIKPRLFCPGPTPVTGVALGALLKTNVYHRSSEFYATVKNCRRLLAPFFGSEEEPLILTASGTGAMEAAVANLTAAGDKVIVVSTGKFGERWQKMTERFGCAVHTLEVPWGSSPTPQMIVEALRISTHSKAIFIQANETSTAVAPPLAELCAAIRQTAPECLIVVDAISALIAHEIKMDDWGIDCIIAGSQKGFGIPPGLSFINLSQRAWGRLSDRPRFYFDLSRERKEQATGATAWTPATGLILALEQALESLAKLGPTKCAAHHQRLAKSCRTAAEALGLKLLAESYPSDAVTALILPDSVDGEALLKFLRARYGAIFAGGQDRLKGRIVRISHLGCTDELDLITAIAALEFGLHESRYDFRPGTGVAAATAALLAV